MEIDSVLKGLVMIYRPTRPLPPSTNDHHNALKMAAAVGARQPSLPAPTTPWNQSRGAGPARSARESFFSRLPRDILNELVDFIPNELEELQSFRLVSKDMLAIFNDFGRHKLKTATLKSRAEKIHKLNLSAQIREFKAIVEHAGSKETPLRGVELKQVLAPLMNFLAEKVHLFKDESEWTKLFESVIEVAFNAKDAICRRDCFLLVAEKLAFLKGPAREAVLQYALEKAETTAVVQDGALRSTVRLILEAERIGSHPEDQRAHEAMRILAATDAPDASIQGRGRHSVALHVLDWLKNHSSASRHDVMRSAIDIVMNDRRGKDRSAGLGTVLNKIRCFFSDLMPDAVEHALHAVLDSSMSDQGKVECLEGVMEVISRSPTFDRHGTLENVLNMVSRFADPKAELRAYACMWKNARHHMDEQAYWRTLGRAQDIVLSGQETPERASRLIDILEGIGHLPPATRSGEYIRALDTLSEAGLSDKERWKCELFIARQVYNEHSTDSSVAKALLPGIAGMKVAADELTALACILGSRQVAFSDAGGEAALKRAQTLLANSAIADATRLRALHRILRRFDNFPDNVQDALFNQTLETIRSFEKDMDKANSVWQLNRVAVCSPQRMDAVLSFVQDMLKQFTDDDALVVGALALYLSKVQKRKENEVMAMAIENFDRVKDDGALLTLIQTVIDIRWRERNRWTELLKLSLNALGRISGEKKFYEASAIIPWKDVEHLYGYQESLSFMLPPRERRVSSRR